MPWSFPFQGSPDMVKAMAHAGPLAHRAKYENSYTWSDIVIWVCKLCKDKINVCLLSCTNYSRGYQIGKCFDFVFTGGTHQSWFHQPPTVLITNTYQIKKIKIYCNCQDNGAYKDIIVDNI